MSFEGLDDKAGLLRFRKHTIREILAFMLQDLMNPVKIMSTDVLQHGGELHQRRREAS